MGYIDVFSKKELVYLLKEIKSNKAADEERGIKFDILDILTTYLQFQYNYNFSILDASKMLLYEEEQSNFIHFIDSSEFPYTKLDFQADQVRRRFWDRNLYFEFSVGHVISFEVLYDLNNLKEFHNNFERLKNFSRLKHLNFLLFNDSELDFKNKLSTFHSLERVNVYRFKDNNLRKIY